MLLASSDMLTLVAAYHLSVGRRNKFLGRVYFHFPLRIRAYQYPLADTVDIKTAQQILRHRGAIEDDQAVFSRLCQREQHAS
jgi:hypothetical protein